MGYTSVHGNDIGRQYWQSSGKETIAPEQNSALLDQFSEFPGPTAFSFSALFEVDDSRHGAVTLHCNSLLVAIALKLVKDADDLRVEVRDSSRAPILTVKGLSVEGIAREVIRGYSENIAASFDNFD
ncbi:Fc.00g081210.m01.CDS01 [Cosmosporella sp. VM-42]